MSLASIRAQAQARTEAVRFTETCTVRRATGETTDPTSGAVTPTYADPDPYEGPCRLKQHNAAASSADAGEDYVLLQQPELHLPMSADLLQPGDEATITASTADEHLVDRVVLVRDLPGDGNTSARRYGVTERTG
jgi:hypothetical protein